MPPNPAGKAAALRLYEYIVEYTYLATTPLTTVQSHSSNKHFVIPLPVVLYIAVATNKEARRRQGAVGKRTEWGAKRNPDLGGAEHLRRTTFLFETGILSERRGFWPEARTPSGRRF